MFTPLFRDVATCPLYNEGLNAVIFSTPLACNEPCMRILLYLFCGFFCCMPIKVYYYYYYYTDYQLLPGPNSKCLF